MWQYAAKTLISLAVILAASEIAKRSTLFGALIASLPLTSLLVIVWLYRDTGDAARIASMSLSIFWLVLASLPFFLVLPALLRHGLGFWASLGLASLSAALCVGAVNAVLARFPALT